MERQTQVGDFWQITRYNSKMVQDRCIISIKVEEEVICTLSNGDIAGDIGLPLTPPQTSPFCIAFHILVVHGCT